MTNCSTHPWKALPCPLCRAGRVLWKESRETPLGSLPALYHGEPTLASTGSPMLSEWVYDLNKDITPDDVRPGDNNVTLWWTCSNPHHNDYQATLAQRAKGRACPECTGVPRAEYVWRIVKALAAGELSEVAALAILARHGIVDESADISGPVVTGMLAAVRDEGLLSAIDTNPEAVLEAVQTTFPPEVDAVREALGFVPEDAPEMCTGLPDLGTPTPERAAADLEALLDRAEAGADVLAEGGILADLLGDDRDMAERLVREIEADLWDAAAVDPTATVERAYEMAAKGGRHAEAAGSFLHLHEAARSLVIPGLAYQIDGEPIDLRMSQRRAVVTLEMRSHVLNLMTVGGGKTLAAIAAGMKVGVENAIVVCPAPLVGQWMTEIAKAYGSHAVEIHTSLASRSRDDRPDWWVLSVDTFSNPANESDLSAFTTEVGADYLVIDEIHKAKQRGATSEAHEATVSARSTRLREFRAALAESNPTLRVMGMTGTPTLNDLSEPISLLELTTGERLTELGTRPTPGNVALVALEMRRHGIITRPDPGMSVHDPVRDAASPATVEDMLDEAAGFVTVDLSDRFGDLVVMAASGVRSGLPIERMVLDHKAEAFADFAVRALAEDRALDPSAVIVAFTRHVDAVDDERIVRDYRDSLEARGLRVRTFTASDRIPETDLSAESLGCDVVIGTQPMGTGVDGLQGHARRLVILSAPWTWAEHEQVVGRIARSGQSNEVVVNPVVGWFDLPSGRKVSLEAIDLLRILRKKRLADAVLYGTLPEAVIPDEAEVLTALLDWQEEVDRMALMLLDPEALHVPLGWWEIITKTLRSGAHTPHTALGLLSRFHARWFREETVERTSRQAEVVTYGETLEVARAAWSHDPALHIANHLRSAARGKVVIDAGCSAVNPRVAIALDGLATVRSYDMAAVHEKVLVADVTNLPEDNEVADYYVLSQAIMGTNAEDYLREAHRVLREDGILYLAETATHFGEDEAGFDAHLRSLGFQPLHTERIGSSPEFVIVKAMKVGPPAPVAVPWQWAHIG